MFQNAPAVALSLPVLLLIAAGLLVAMALLCWLVWGRSLGTLQTELAEKRERLASAARELHGEQIRSQQAQSDSERYRGEVSTLQQQITALTGEISAAKAAHDAQSKAMAERLAELARLRTDIQENFQGIAGSALQANQQQFLQLANEVFAKHREGATQDLTKSRQDMAALLTPMKTTLDEYRKNLKEIEEARNNAYGGLNQQLSVMAEDQMRLRSETQNLVNALRSGPKTAGRWGERQLRNVLEMAGLSEYVDYQLEVHVEGDDGTRLRPDAIIRLPGGHQLVVDAKTSWGSYQAAHAATSDSERMGHLKAHAASLRKHAADLGRKSYTDQFERAPDFVLMFVAGEQFVSAAVDVDPELWEFALQRRVLIVSPTSLIAVARTVSYVWRQEQLTRQAMEIGELGRELYGRMRTMGDRLASLGRSLQSSVTGYNNLVGTVEARVMPAARKFTELAIETNAEPLPESPRIEVAMRLPSPGKDLEVSEVSDVTGHQSVADTAAEGTDDGA